MMFAYVYVRVGQPCILILTEVSSISAASFILKSVE